MSRSHPYAIFLRHAALPLIGRLQGMPVSPTLRALEQSQWWPPEELRALQLAKLRRLADHAYTQVPLYRRLWNAHGVQPQAIRTPGRPGPPAAAGQAHAARGLS